jgi:hypothetical protein
MKIVFDSVAVGGLRVDSEWVKWVRVARRYAGKRRMVDFLIFEC